MSLRVCMCMFVCACVPVYAQNRSNRTSGMPEWAIPIFPVLKPDGAGWICGNYDLTINRTAKSDTYPLPHVKDLFAILAGENLLLNYRPGTCLLTGILVRILETVAMLQSTVY